MIIDSTARKYQVVLTAAKTTNDMPVIVNWEPVSRMPNLVPALARTNTNGLTAVDILTTTDLPKSIKEITIYNNDTAAKTVQVLLNDSGTAFLIVNATLQPGETLGYAELAQWYAQDASGNRKTIAAATLTNLADTIHAATTKSTPVTADEFGIWDSVSLALRKCTWGNIVTTLQTAFASLTFSVGPATAATHAVRADQNKNELTSVSATIATGKLTLGLQPCIIPFRNSDVTNGAPNTKFVSAALTLATDNNGASFGLTTAVQGRLIMLAVDNGTATPVLGVVNLSGGTSLTEEGVLTSTTAITGAVVSATTVYTTVALGAGLYPYKVVGAVDITWTSGSGYITTPALVTGAGGNALTNLNSFGYGTSQDLTGSKLLATTYYNDTGKPREVDFRITVAGGALATVSGTVDGKTKAFASVNATYSIFSGGFKLVVQPGKSYSIQYVSGTFTSSSWFETI